MYQVSNDCSIYYTQQKVKENDKTPPGSTCSTASSVLDSASQSAQNATTIQGAHST